LPIHDHLPRVRALRAKSCEIATICALDFLGKMRIGRRLMPEGREGIDGRWILEFLSDELSLAIGLQPKR
jgi:hypothetical protein